MSMSIRAAAARAFSVADRLRRPRSIEERVGMIALSLALLVSMGQAALAHEFKAGSIEIVHPHTPAPPAGAQVAAGYLTLKNEGDTPDRLVAATGSIAGTTQIHEMTVENGLMTMKEVAGGLEIPPGGEVSLKPGSFHIMFMKLKQPVQAGETFKGTLTFEKAGTVEIEYSVDGKGGGNDDHAH